MKILINEFSISAHILAWVHFISLFMQHFYYPIFVMFMNILLS